MNNEISAEDAAFISTEYTLANVFEAIKVAALRGERKAGPFDLSMFEDHQLSDLGYNLAFDLDSRTTVVSW